MPGLVPLLASALLTSTPVASAAAPPGRPAFERFDPKLADPAVAPCEDFYAYACNTWMRENPVPADRGRLSRGVRTQRTIYALLREELERAAQPRPGRSASERQLGDTYAACMDEPRIEALGVGVLGPQLRSLSALRSKRALAPVLARLHAATYNLAPLTDTGIVGATALFSFTSWPGMHAAGTQAAWVDQGGMGLPDRDLYLASDAESAAVRSAYAAHVARLLQLSGESEASARESAQSVLRVETALARGAQTLLARREPSNLDHVLSRAQLQALTPSFDWAGYLRAVGAPQPATFQVGDPGFLAAVEAQLRERSLPEWKAYLRWHLVHASASLLPRALVEEHFAFYGRRLDGAKELAPRWLRCVRAADRDLGEALGERFVQRAYPPQSHARATRMVQAIQEAMAQQLQQVDWMGPSTREEALTKLRSVLAKVGHPERPRDYAGIHTTRTTALANAQAASAFELRRRAARIGRPVDRSEWLLSASTSDGYFDDLNTMNIPAGLLVPPDFDPELDEAANFGAIGSLIGHELIHGFDDRGRRYDAQGNLRDWWAPDDAQRFEARARCFVGQYSAYTAVDDVRVNGALTLAENTADNGGLRLSYAAWRHLLAAQQRTPTPEEERRFFLAYAQSWCTSMTPQALRLEAQTNPHASSRFRVNGTLSNQPEFHRAYACRAGQPMVHAPACRVW